MMPIRGTLFLGLSLLAMVGLSQGMQCEEPNWPANSGDLGDNPMVPRRGKVVLVAMLKGYCGFCVVQAARMEALKTELINEGYQDIDMLIINGGDPLARTHADRLINASSIPVIQDTEEQVLYREVFRARKDDFLVYDRCGQAAIYIPHPYSNLAYGITKRVLKRIHNGRHSCYCSLDHQARRNMDDVMMGDDPGSALAPSSASIGNPQQYGNDPIDCSPRDTICQRFLRVFRRQARRYGSPDRPSVFMRANGPTRHRLFQMPSGSGRANAQMRNTLSHSASMFGRDNEYDAMINRHPYATSNFGIENESTRNMFPFLTSGRGTHGIADDEVSSLMPLVQAQNGRLQRMGHRFGSGRTNFNNYYRQLRQLRNGRRGMRLREFLRQRRQRLGPRSSARDDIGV